MRGLRGAGGAPPVTVFLVVVNVACGALQFLMDEASTRRFTLSANAVFVEAQWYRVVSSAFLHGGALHLGMNMLSTLAIGGALEREVGSAALATYVAWAVPLTGAAAAAVAMAWSALSGDPAHAAQHSLGFSGVLFALAASEAWRPPDRPRSIFGLATVPGAYYPWALLVAMQIAIPRVSFVGHLAGLLVGAAEVKGALACLVPSRRAFAAADAIHARHLALPNYAPTPAAGGDRAMLDPCGVAALLAHVAAFLLAFFGVADCCAGLKARVAPRADAAASAPAPAATKTPAPVGAVAEV